MWQRGEWCVLGVLRTRRLRGQVGNVPRACTAASSVLGMGGYSREVQENAGDTSAASDQQVCISAELAPCMCSPASSACMQYLNLQFASYDLDPICTPISSMQCTTMIVVRTFFAKIKLASLELAV